MRSTGLYPLLFVIGAIGLFTSSGCEKKIKLDTDAQKATYAIGQQIGQNLKGQNIDFDPAVLAASIKDVKDGKTPMLTPEQMQQALQKLQEGINVKQQEAAETNKTEGAAFLEKNKSEAGVKVTPSGLQYIILTEGTGKVPTINDTVKAHYKGTLINGQQFDSSYDRGQPSEFPVGGVIKGWTEALTMLKVGSKVKLFIPSDLGYGPSARPGIPANSVLIFEVELIDIVGAPAAAAPAEGKKKK